MKPTQKWIDGLRWIAQREPVGCFNEDAPSRVVRNKLMAHKLIEACGIEPGRFGVAKFRLTARGRALIKQKVTA